MAQRCLKTVPTFNLGHVTVQLPLVIATVECDQLVEQ